MRVGPTLFRASLNLKRQVKSRAAGKYRIIPSKYWRTAGRSRLRQQRRNFAPPLFPCVPGVPQSPGFLSSCVRATLPVPIRKLTGYQPEIDAIKSNYRPLLLALSRTGIKRGGENSMMDRLRSPMRTLGMTAVLICALSLAGLGMSHARPSHAPVQRHGLPCNAACKAYMSWSHRVAAMFRPSRPLKRIAAHHGNPPRMMVHHAPRTRMAHHAPRLRQSGLNSFAQLPAPGDATREPAEASRAVQAPQVAEMPPAAEAQGEVAPSRPTDRIADRFPTAAEFMRAGRAGTDSPTDDDFGQHGYCAGKHGCCARRPHHPGCRHAR